MNFLQILSTAINDFFEDYKYSQRFNYKSIDNVVFIPEHKCYTGNVGIAIFSSENINLYNALLRKGVQIIPHSSYWDGKKSAIKEWMALLKTEKDILLIANKK